MTKEAMKVNELLNEARNNIVEAIYEGETNGILSSDEIKKLEDVQEVIDLIITRLVKEI